MAALKTERLVKRFEELTAVNEVDLEINPGEIVGVLGPNGAGKTTLLRMLAGILTPTSGRIVVKGLDLREFPLEAKKEIGFLSGDAQLYQRLTPSEALCYFGRLYEIPEQILTSRIDELIGELEMTSFANRPCRTLSTGQRQRANIARAFLHQPSVVLLDEPTAALDVLSSQFIIKTIRQERATGRAVLLSTHLMAEAESLCDRIYLLHQGRVADHGPLNEILLRASSSSLTEAFLFHAAPHGAGAAQHGD